MNLIGRVLHYFFGLRAPRLPEESTRAQRGKFGEDLSVNYCQQELGYSVIVRNWGCGRDGIDLICQDGEVLVFIEVRARSEDALIKGVVEKFVELFCVTGRLNQSHPVRRPSFEQ